MMMLMTMPMMHEKRNCVSLLSRDKATLGPGNEYKARLFTISNKEDDDGLNYANDDDDDEAKDDNDDDDKKKHH